ncbi:hypothetical protein [Dokdonella soli]|uniref:DUF2569 family protein n=1 Tax=Dokdonella soli TaxID=529810 RepID=A0ABN1IDB8_9GAMM
MPVNPFVRFFTPDPRHEGVRPVQLWGLRLFYFLMLVFVAPSAWRGLLTHAGAWDPVRAVAIAVWATYPALALFGLFRPLRWLPLMFFTIGYKTIWLAFVAWPLWRVDMLWGTPTGDVAGSFLALPLLAAVVPWGYAWRMYFAWPRKVVNR